MGPGREEVLDTVLDVSERTEAGTNAGASACSLVNWPPNALPLAVTFCTVCCVVAGRALPLPLLLLPLEGFCSLGSDGTAVAVLGGAMFAVRVEGRWREGC